MTEKGVALITGASGSIGGEIAVQLAADGYTCILMGRKRPLLEKLYDRIVEQGSPQPAVLPLDFIKAHWGNYEEIAQVVEREFGRLDVLVHAAADFSGLQPLNEADLNQWANTLQTNLTAPYLLTRALLGLLASAKPGRVVMIGDSVSETPRAYWGAYSIAKAGLANMSAMLDEELQHAGVRFMTAVPDPTDSPLRRLAFPAEDAGMLKSAAQTAQEILALF